MFLGYYPPKFLTGEVIHNGNLPLWNPYISFGIPFYGDMNGGYWSPVTWLIALTTGYNVYILTIEVMFYLWIGGLGMFYLTSHWINNKSIRLIAAVSFMCCGFNVGHLQHLNWISGAAFLPWCLWIFIKLNKDFSLRNYLLCALLFYFLLSSAHPGIIIGSFYFFTGLLITYLIKSYQTNKIKGVLKTSGNNFLFLLFLIIPCAGIIAGYSDIIPYFSRGEIVSLKASLAEPTNLQSWLSLLFPLITTKNQAFFQNDIAMRNSYFGVLLFIFFAVTIFKTKTTWQKFFIFAGLLFALLSSGGIFKTAAYYVLPLIGYIRLNGEFRLFAILCFIPAAAIQLNKYITGESFLNIPRFIKPASVIISLLIIALAVYKLYATQDSIIYSSAFVQSNLPLNSWLKKMIDSISFYDTVIMQVIIQLTFLLLILNALLKKNIKWLLLLSITDLSLATELNLPFTGVGKTSVAQLINIHNRAPKGIITPALQPLFKNDTLQRSDSSLIGEWGFYNKQPGSPKRVIYPVLLKNTAAYYDAIEKDSSANMKNNPFIFFGKTSGNTITADSNNHLSSNNIILYTTNRIELQFNAKNETEIILLQNYYPHWYYYKNNKRFAVEKAGLNFMRVPVSAGENKIIIQFEPTRVKAAMLLSFIVLLIYCLILLLPVTKPVSLS